MNNRAWIGGTILLVVLLFGAFFLFSSSNQPNATNTLQTGIGGGPESSPTIDPAQAKTNLQRNLQAYTLALTIHLQNLYDGEDVTSTAQRLETNTDQFVALVGQLSGKKSTGQLESFLDDQIKLYEEYTLALKENNTSEAERVKNELSMHATEFGNTIHSLMPSVQAESASNALREHSTAILASIDAHAADNRGMQLAQTAKATAQTATFAESLMPKEQ